MDENKFKGTTTLGIICQDGIILAADKRATMGNFISNKEMKKVWKIDDNLAITIAGGVGDAQEIIRILKLHNEIYKMNESRPMSPKSAVSLLSVILNNNKMVPFYIQLIIGGLDNNNKPQLFNLDPGGGYTEEKAYTTTGSGTEFAVAYLDDNYSENMLTKDVVKIAAKAISAAIKRDIFTGDAILVATITKDGYKEYTGKDLEKMIASK